MQFEKQTSNPEIRRFSRNSMDETTEKERKELTINPTISEPEANLLLEISNVFSAEKRQRYDELYAKFKNENLNQKERKELLKLSDEFEILNAKRLEYLAKLAELRGQPLKDVIKDLGIKP